MGKMNGNNSQDINNSAPKSQTQRDIENTTLRIRDTELRTN